MTQDHSMKRLALFALLALALPAWAEPPAPKALLTSEVLFWSQARREADFQRMEELSARHLVAAAPGKASPLPDGAPLAFDIGPNHQSLDAFMAENRTAGVLVIQDGKVRLERYALGFNRTKRWTSFSVAKSVTSTLIGAAVQDGYIKSIDDPVTLYLPELKGSGYDGVSIRQVLTMTSGVGWNEDYFDPKSDVAQLFQPGRDPTMDRTLEYMSGLKRAFPPGTHWNYSTGETNLIGLIVRAAIKRDLAGYLSEKIWKPYGMERDAYWQVDNLDHETGGCCLSITLRDYGRIGLFILGDGMAGGKRITPAGWVAAATHKQAETGEPGHGYGYQWWTDDVGSVNAYGIFGQRIHIDPSRKLVIVVVSAWPAAVGRKWGANDAALSAAIAAALDKEKSQP